MTIQATKINVGAYRGMPKDFIQQTISSKIAQQAAMERALLNQKYWDELLEKLRKMGGGGGGGGDSRFDRVVVSMQLMNFFK